MEIILGILFLYILNFIFNPKDKCNKQYNSLTYNKKQTNSGIKHNYNDCQSWDSVRKQVLDKYGHKCSYCGVTGTLNIHHKIPLSEGGTNDLCNLIPLCKRCHQNIHKFKFVNKSINIPQNYGFNISKDKKQKKGYIIIYAIKNKYRLLIRYKANEYFKNGEITKRIILPKTLCMGCEIENEYLVQDEVYVSAFCELRQENRIFKLDKIEILKMLN